MFKGIYNKYKKNQAIKEQIAAEQIARKQSEELDLNITLYTQSINNVIHIRAAISTISAIFNSVKGKSLAETNKRKELMKSQMKWYENKLNEEIAMVNHFASILKIQKNN